MVQGHGNQQAGFLKNVPIVLPCDPAISLLGIKQGFKQVFVYPCSYLHYAQQSKGESNPSATDGMHE